MEQELKNFIRDFEQKVIPLNRETNLSYYNASISGKEEDYVNSSNLQKQLIELYSNRTDFELLKKLKETDSFSDPILKRQVELYYNDFAGNQFSDELQKEIIDLSTIVESKFSTFRVEVNDKKLTDNEIDDFLETSKDSIKLESIWKSSKFVGNTVVNDVLKLVKLRNKAANEIGYDNYHTMSLKLSELEPDDLDDLFDELDRLTRGEFESQKGEIDNYLSQNYGIPVNDLMPWHYQDKFFQQGPQIYKINFDEIYSKEDVVQKTIEYFDGINLEIRDLVEKSDLYDKEGKYQHAYCTNIDRDGDVRVICNVKPNYKWMGTMLHEYGHAVYDKYVSPKLPWQLRNNAHILSTESIAMLFGRFASNPQWIQDMIGISDEQKLLISENCKKLLRMEQLVFSRWVQVMYRFERELYNNPDQDLNTLWWNLVEDYQLLKKPEGRDEPDWASKIHLALYPAYYHNYMLGELMASQLYIYITTKVLKSGIENESFFEKPEVGEYLKNLIFSYGSLLNWQDLIVNATGEKLTPRHYAEQFVSYISNQ